VRSLAVANSDEDNAFDNATIGGVRVAYFDSNKDRR